MTFLILSVYLPERETEMMGLGVKAVLHSDAGSTCPSWVKWASDLTSLSFSFPMHIMGIKYLTG